MRIQFAFSAKTHYVGRVIKDDPKRYYVDFGMFGTRWVPRTKCVKL